MSKKEIKTENNLENVEQALGKTEQFIETNQKLITIIILALIVVVGGYWAYKKLYVEPLVAEAQQQIFQAQINFNNDEFQNALDGDGNSPGFLEIIDSYGNTSIGNLSQYYAGISYLHLGQFEDAIDHLKKFKTSNIELKALSIGAIGDAYLELGNKDEALDYYKKAAAVEKSDITTPYYLFKSGLVYEELGQTDLAIQAYEMIKDQFKSSSEARQIDKYITRASLK
jgi:tetratricopeptide (TPR) repeat protein